MDKRISHIDYILVIVRYNNSILDVRTIRKADADLDHILELKR